MVTREFIIWGDLAQGVHVVGVHGHNVPVGVGVKVLDGQGFHMGEQVVPQVAHGALADVHHNPVVAVGAEDAQSVHAGHPRQGPAQEAEVRRGRLGQGQNVVVNQRLEEQRAA